MSGRVLFTSVAPVLKRLVYHSARTLAYSSSARVGGLLRTESGFQLRRQHRWPLGASFIHNVPAVRSISFARVLPNLFIKLVRIPALFGGAAIAGLAYLQYQASQASNYVVDLFSRVTDSASTIANGFYQGANDIAQQTKERWYNTKSTIALPAWLENMVTNEHSSGGGDSRPGDPGPEDRKSSANGGAMAAGVVSAVAFGHAVDVEDDSRSDEGTAKDDQIMLFTKKMIEIRSLLQTVGQSDALTLPSIVVIGSQSSGKSSVLEAIVGHEFLPKGSNMVTRRPIELTLVNTPDGKSEYGEFPALGQMRMTDFSQIQKTLTDLNLAVPETECVSDDPIQLRIYSPKVPDLSLIDLPGYIQVAGEGQPSELKERIADLCEKYLKSPNIILAISAADVDLANSTALRASRRVDPRGERTIGVITKMDLVDPERGASILEDKKYPLRLGYVGVICKIPHSSSLFSRSGGDISNTITKNEREFFSAHPSEFGPEAQVTVGMTNLRRKLMYVLEQTMATSLASTSEAIQHELAEASYEFKVQYNDRPLSAESYLAENLDAFKHSFKSFSEGFGRLEIRQLLKHELDQQVLNLLAQRYWNKPIDDLTVAISETSSLNELPKSEAEMPLWRSKLDASSSSLTKLGIGRLATNVVASSLQARIERLVSTSTFGNHPSAHQVIMSAAASILRDLSFETSDELEICIKPYKFRIDFEDSEWIRARENISVVLKEELRTCEGALKGVEIDVGGKKRLKDVIGFIDRVRKGEIVLEGDGSGGAGGFSAALLRRGREAVFLRDRSEIIKMRLVAIRSKQCAIKKNRYYCPEVFLDAVADKLTTTADLFLDAELLSKFYYLFPRELDARLGRNLSATDLERFAREDPRIKRHLDVVKRKDLLEQVLKEMDSLRQLEARERRYTGAGAPAAKLPMKTGGKGWSLF